MPPDNGRAQEALAGERAAQAARQPPGGEQQGADESPGGPSDAASSLQAPSLQTPSLQQTPSATPSANLADVQDTEPVATCAILLPTKYPLSEGALLWGGVKLGRLLGAGVQARVFELDYSDGRPTGKVLKIAHTDLAHRFLNNPILWIGMEREWEIGTQLRAALEEPGGRLPGFMRMCDCLVHSDDPASGRARFSGMIMEKLNGWEVYKRIDTPEFHNIHYIREMLFQVFSALDRAQRKLGFHHADLGMRNVMEHYPRLWDEPEGKEGGPAGGRGGVHAAEPAGPGGPGCLVCQEQPGEGEGEEAAGETPGSEPATPFAAAGGQQPQGQPWWRRRSGGGGQCGLVRPRAGFSCNADGSRLPLGPHIEFKVIDFGVAVFDGQLAQVAGGYESEEVMRRLQEVFTAKHITFGGQQAAAEDSQIQMATSEGAGLGSKGRTWHLLPTSVSSRFRVKQTPPGALPVPTAGPGALEAAADAAAAAVAAEAGAAGGPAGEASRSRGGGSRAGAQEEGLERPQRYRSATLLREPGTGMARAGELMRASQAAPAAAAGSARASESEMSAGSASHVQHNPQRLDTRPPTYRQSPVEKFYRHFWERKGDVFHLLLGMALVLDDRVWPKQDERDVHLFTTLVHHVTGVRMKASFADEANPRSSGFFGRLACAAAPRVKEGDRHPLSVHDFGRWGKWQHFFRRWQIRLSAHWRPFNSGLLAGEALASPFFGAGHVAHAQLPVCVEQAFPRSSD